MCCTFWTFCISFCIENRFSVYGTLLMGPTMYVWIRIANAIWPRSDFRSSVSKAITEQFTYDPAAICTFLFVMSLLEGKTRSEAKHEVSDGRCQVEKKTKSKKKKKKWRSRWAKPYISCLWKLISACDFLISRSCFLNDDDGTGTHQNTHTIPFRFVRNFSTRTKSMWSTGRPYRRWISHLCRCEIKWFAQVSSACCGVPFSRTWNICSSNRMNRHHLSTTHRRRHTMATDLIIIIFCFCFCVNKFTRDTFFLQRYFSVFIWFCCSLIAYRKLDTN